LVGSDARTAYLHDLAIIGGLAVCVAVMVLVSRMARKPVMQAVAEIEKAGGLESVHAKCRKEVEQSGRCEGERKQV